MRGTERDIERDWAGPLGTVSGTKRDLGRDWEGLRGTVRRTVIWSERD